VAKPIYAPGALLRSLSGVPMAAPPRLESWQRSVQTSDQPAARQALAVADTALVQLDRNRESFH
jgi:hypothetical protein